MTMRLYQTGERGKADVLNRPWQQMLEQSGLASDGSDFKGFIPAAYSPASWALRRDSNNPVIDYTDDPLESPEPNGTSYVPAPVKIGDDVYVYVKTDFSKVVRLWRFADGAEDTSTPALIGTAISTGSAGAWDDQQCAETAAWYDEDNSLVHLLYKGFGSVTGAWGIGYATAPSSAPGTVTKSVSSPVITAASVEAGLGLAPGSVNDVGVGDFVKDDEGTWHVFGWYGTGTNDIRVIKWTGSSLTSLTIHPAVLLSPPPITPGGDPVGLAYIPCVFRHPSANVWVMFYCEGWSRTGAEVSYPRVAFSQDLVTWEASDEFLMLPLDLTEVRNHTARILKGGASNDTPILVRGEYQLWYSMSPNAHDVVGLAYLSPQNGRDGKRRPGVEVWSRTNQSVPHGANIDAGWTDVQWGTRIIESPRGWMEYQMEPLANPEGTKGTTWTCRAAGRYRIEANLGDGFVANATGQRGLQIIRNMATVPAISVVNSVGATIRTSVAVSCTIDLVEGDEIKVRAWQNSGGALSFGAYWGYPVMSITRVD